MSEDRITLQFDSFRGFLEACSDRVSEEGIFLATEDVRPVGSRVEFHLRIDPQFPLLRGTGEVVWVVEPDGAGEVPGMAVRYQSTDPATATLARKIAERQRTRTGAAFELDRAGAAEPAAAAAEPPPPAEPSPSPVTQAVDVLIDREGVETEVGPEAEAVFDSAAAAPEPPPEIEPEPVAAPAPVAEPIVPSAASEEPTAEMPASPKRGRRGMWAILALIAALAGAAYWQRDLLLGGKQAPAPEAREPVVQAPVEPELRPPVEPATREPDDPGVEPSAEVEPLEADAPAPPAAETVPAPSPSGPLSRIEEIRWRASVGVTLLELVADGAFDAGGYTLERLEDPPRLLLKISGVTAPLASPTVAVGSEEVVGVRTGLHGAPPASELHVVVDLADPTAQATAAEAGAVLQLRIASSAISP